MSIDLIKVEVPTGRGLRDVAPYIIGRNGYYEITALQFYQRSGDDAGSRGVVDIQAVGKRKKLINGGFFAVRTEDIDALCKAWIEARGGLVIMPDDDEVTALVTMCDGVIDEVIVSRDLHALEVLGKQHTGDDGGDKYQCYLECVELVAGENGP